MHQDGAESPRALRARAPYVAIALALLILPTAILFLHESNILAASNVWSHRRIPHPQDHSRKQPRGRNAPAEAVRLDGVNSTYAFATLLMGTPSGVNWLDDKYFIATRLLTYQLVHALETRSQDVGIPFIVMVTDKVHEPARDRLRKDGAVVVEVPLLGAGWIKPGRRDWANVMTKLRAWELVDFERVVVLDADTILATPLDDIFTDPAVEEQTVLSKDIPWPGNSRTNLTTYVFGGNAENLPGHHFPPSQEGRDWLREEYMNAGFFVIKPDIDLLRYYISIMRTPMSFDPTYPEQNLLDEVHGRRGNMPWKQINTTFNIHFATMKDVELGAKSIHEKWWLGGPLLHPWMVERKGRMEGYFEARDQMGEAGPIQQPRWRP